MEWIIVISLLIIGLILILIEIIFIPGTTIYIFTGITFSELFQNSQIPEFNITSSKYFLIILLLSILSLSPIIFKKFLKNKIRG